MNLLTVPGTTSFYHTNIRGENRICAIETPPGFNFETGKVMFFFKGQGSPSTVAIRKRFAPYLKENNCIGVFPEALKRGKKTAQWAVTGDSMESDIQFFSEVYAWLHHYPLMISGVSNGGCFALLLTSFGEPLVTCTFAASVWQGLDFKYPSNIYAIHGMKDKSVPYNGGPAHGLTFYSAEQSITMSYPFPEFPVHIESMPGNATLTIYQEDTSCQLLSVPDAGHNVMTQYKGIDTIQSIFSFFNKIAI
jgi:poly(3-hydroxybutyrate) depolymerase